MKKTIFIDIIVILFMILFIYTSISKITDYAIFKDQLSESPILAPLSPLLAALLPIIELIAALALLFPHWRLLGFYMALTLMITFTIYIILIVNFSNTIPCSCGGILAEMTWTQHLFFNSFFILLSIFGIILERKLKTSRKGDSTTSNKSNSHFQAT